MRGAPALTIEILTIKDCPNAQATRGAVEAAVAALGLEARVRCVDQDSLSADDPRRSWPSPTVLANGRELFGMPLPSGAASAACRVYPNGAPSAQDVSQAIRTLSPLTLPKTAREDRAMALSIRDFKVYVPAKDFELSKRFYTALGFTMSLGWGGTADFELDGQRFRLQDYYVKDWANNFMVVMGVDDVAAWHERARTLAQSGEFRGMSVRPPEPVDGSLVLHVGDPSGVLLVFVQ